MSTETPRYDVLEPRHKAWDAEGGSWSRAKIDDLLCDTLSALYDSETELTAAQQEIERLTATIAAKDEAIKRLNGWLDNDRRALGEEG